MAERRATSFALRSLHAARHALEDLEKLDPAASEALALARASDVATLEGGGSPASRLLDALASEQATLLVVGTLGLGRAAGVLLGSVATRAPFWSRAGPPPESGLRARSLSASRIGGRGGSASRVPRA